MKHSAIVCLFLKCTSNQTKWNLEFKSMDVLRNFNHFSICEANLTLITRTRYLSSKSCSVCSDIHQRFFDRSIFVSSFR